MCRSSLIFSTFVFILKANSGRVGILLTGLALPHVCTCPKSLPGFPVYYMMMVLCIHLVMGEVIVHFVDICAIVDHCCFKLSFNNWLEYFLNGLLQYIGSGILVFR